MTKPTVYLNGYDEAWFKVHMFW